MRGLFDDLEKAFVVFGGIGVVDLAKELIGQVAQYGPARFVPVKQIVLHLVLHDIHRTNIVAP